MELLSRLRDSSDEGPTARLAALAVDELLSCSLRDVLHPEAATATLREVLSEWLDSTRGQERLLQAWRDGVVRVKQDETTVGERLPPELQGAIADLLGQPYSPDREFVRRVLDREPIRKLLAELLGETLAAYSSKVQGVLEASPIKGALGMLGGGRGGLLGLAGGVASAVSGEVEKQLEKRSAEVLEGALSGVLQRLVDLLADPARAQEQAELRLALLEGLWEVSGLELAGELERLDPEAASEVFRGLLRTWVADEGGGDPLIRGLRALLQEFGNWTLRQLLDEFDLLASFVDPVTRATRDGLDRLVQAESFSLWLDALLAQRPPEPT